MQLRREGERLMLAGELTVFTVEALYAALKEQLPYLEAQTTIDLSGVETLDIAAAQTLLAFKLLLGDQHVQCVEVPSHVMSMLKTTGLTMLVESGRAS